MARILADEQFAGHLHIVPEAVITSSEVLTDESRRHVEEAWGKVLFNHYGATETGGVAAECDHHHGMHLYDDFVIVEVVDEHNRPVPRGVFGDKLLITVLFKRVQPLIRYELSDSVRLAITPCESDLPFDFIDAVQGRTEELLHFFTPTGAETTVHPNLFHQIMDTIAVSGWQIIQEPHQLTILLSGLRDGFVDETLEQTVQQALGKQGIVVPPIHVQRVAEIPKESSGKTPLIKTTHSQKQRISTTSVRQEDGS
jgi:phenylacetate-coenzyme A ligase PaaK-like adenylate-forming protein